MKSPGASTIVDVTKTTVAVLTVLWLADLLRALFPDLEEPWSYVIGTLAGAVVVEAVWLVVFIRPVLSVEWTTDEDEVPRAQLDAEIGATTKESIDSFRVEVKTATATGLGWAVLRLAVLNGLLMNIQASNTQLLVIVDDCNSDVEGRPLATSLARECGLQVRLPGPPTRQSWGYARLRFRSRGMQRSTFYEMKYKCSASTRIGACCARLIRVDAKAATIRERWS